MQFFSAKPLIEKFRHGTFQEAEVAPYLIATALVQSLGLGLPMSDFDLWSIVVTSAVVIITFGAFFYLKKQNGGTFGNFFVAKYFTLGWVVGVRVVSMLILAFALLFELAFVTGVGEAMFDSPLAWFAFLIVLIVLSYLWLGALFAQAQPASEPPASPQ